MQIRRSTLDEEHHRPAEVYKGCERMLSLRNFNAGQVSLLMTRSQSPGRVRRLNGIQAVVYRDDEMSCNSMSRAGKTKIAQWKTTGV